MYYFAGYLNVSEFFNTNNSNMSSDNSCAIDIYKYGKISYGNLKYKLRKTIENKQQVVTRIIMKVLWV
jgi:hypothetical protein